MSDAARNRKGKVQLLLCILILRDTNLALERGLCTSAHSHPEWAASPTWSERTCRPRSSRRPSRTRGWVLEDVTGGNTWEKEKDDGDEIKRDSLWLTAHFSHSLTLDFFTLPLVFRSFEWTVPSRETILNMGGNFTGCYQTWGPISLLFSPNVIQRLLQFLGASAVSFI